MPFAGGSGTIAFGATGSANTGAGNQATLTATVTINAKDTVIAYAADSNCNPNQVVTSSGQYLVRQSTYILQQSPGAGCTTVWTSPPSGALAATSVTATRSGGNGVYTLAVVTYTGVKSYGLLASATATGSTASTISITTQDNNNFIVDGISFAPNAGGAGTYTGTAGTVRVNVATNIGTQWGLAISDNTAASPGAVANSGTMSVACVWTNLALELRTTTVTPAVNGGIGSLGWGLNGPNNTAQYASVPGGTGVLQLQTGATSENYNNVFLPQAGIGEFAVGNLVFDAIFRVQVPAPPTSSMFCGFSDMVPATAAFNEGSQNFVGIGFDSAQSDSAWMYVIGRQLGNANRVSSGSLIDLQWHDFRIRSITPGTVLFSMDGGTETASTASLPLAPLGIGCSVTTHTGAARNLNIDFVQLKEYSVR